MSFSEGYISAMKSFIEIQNVEPNVVDLWIYTVTSRHITVISDMSLFWDV